MDKRLKAKLIGAVVVALILFVALSLFVLIPRMYNLSADIDFKEDKKAGMNNPLIGYAPWGNDTARADESSLIYIDLTWAQWEPEEGDFDIEGFEERWDIQRWKLEGKHAVLRFICDRPGDEEHLDIPQWLYERTGDGVFYELEYGRGYAPDYENEAFIEAHERAMKALGDYCNQDTFFSYVELGSIGHWGEWHTRHEDGVPPLPGASTCWIYANHYADSFYNARLLMRRNFVMAVDGSMGLYNDMTGDHDETMEWLDWQKNGGSYALPEGEIPYKACEGLWMTAPIGGEFTPSGSMEDMLDRDLEQTEMLVRDSHMSFIGPNTPLEYRLSEDASEGADKIKGILGYRYWISHMDIDMDYMSQDFVVSLTWENSGSAPIYFPWMAMMYVYDENGECRYWEEIDVELSRLLPGETSVTENRVPFNDLFRNGYSIGIGVLDPLTEEPEIELCMNKEFRDGVNMIYSYDGEKGTAFDTYE